MISTSSNHDQVRGILGNLLFDLSGVEIDQSSATTSFLELGFDSLFLIQFSTGLKRELGIEVSFRQMLEETSTFESLVGHVVSVLPEDALPDAPSVDTELPVPESRTQSNPTDYHNGANGNAPSQPNMGLVNGSSPDHYAHTNGSNHSANLPPQPNQLSAQLPTALSPMPSAVSIPPVSTASQIAPSGTGLEAIMAQQLQVMSMQLAALSGQVAPAQHQLPTSGQGSVTTQETIPAQPFVPPSIPMEESAQWQSPSEAAQHTDVSQATTDDNSSKSDARPAKSSQEMKPFGAIARIQTKKSDELSPHQQVWLDDFIARYNNMTAQSKEFTAKYQHVHADPRVVSGFKSKIKELIYPIVADRTNGCRIWDLDGNEYIDALNGFGSNFFGYANPDITKAVVDQMWRGVEIGPQCPLTGEAASLICEFTGMDRVGFCNTGSEAVMGAMRIARTVTGRDLIVIFSGSYHGIFDEVIVRSTPNLRSVPAAPGIMPSSVENVLVLEYGTEESLQIIRERIDELAAVMVEPVQSRRPEFQPREFLHELRRITADNQVPFIFDEVITGFRTEPGGAQAYFGIQADIATYGKVVGGGMHIGIVAGKAKYMDALDGGPWQYGDDSVPEVGVTYFAGTFVRHPASVAACLAAMRILKDQGPELQQRINGQTTYLASELNNFFRDRSVPLEVTFFGSLWRITYTETIPYGELLFYLTREKGIHIYDGFPCFLTMAHTDDDVEAILSALRGSVLELQAAGFLAQPSEEIAQTDFFVPAS